MSEKKFMVAHSTLTNTISAGVPNKDGTEWLEHTEVTEQAIEAVRDYCVQNLAEKYYKDSKENPDCKKPTAMSFQWRRKDGAVVSLSVHVKMPDETPEKEQKVN